jgi:hypothetical protein
LQFKIDSRKNCKKELQKRTAKKNCKKELQKGKTDPSIFAPETLK